jgi:hypothetical protein
MIRAVFFTRKTTARSVRIGDVEPVVPQGVHGPRAIDDLAGTKAELSVQYPENDHREDS